jgi:hypothetical protein
VNRFRTGFLCLALGWTLAIQAQDAPPQQPPAQAPAQQTPAPQEPGQPVGGTRLPPPPPKVVDVRMPGEAGWYLGITGWVPVGTTYIDKGRESFYSASSYFEQPGTNKVQPGGELGIAVGLHNSLRFTYMSAKAAGTTVPANDLVLFSQFYAAGEQLSSSYRINNYKISYEYLTWPYPVEARHFRLKTLWQVQYVTFKAHYDNPVLSSTADSSGNLPDYSVKGSMSFITPTFGLGVHEYVGRNLHLEANLSGFGWPHSFHLIDGDASLGYRIGKIEIHGGVRSLHVHSSANHDYYFDGHLTGAVVGIRWHTD